MITNLYAIYDVVAQDHGPLFEAKNDQVAVRNVLQSLRNVENPGEYRLYYFGSVERDETLNTLRIYPENSKLINFHASSDNSIAYVEREEK